MKKVLCVVVRYLDSEHIFLLEKGIYKVGRKKENAIVLEDQSVSGNHGEFEITSDNQIFYKDIGSRNGTFFNGEKITDRILLKPGEIITLGLCELHISEIEEIEFAKMLQLSDIHFKRGRALDLKNKIPTHQQSEVDIQNAKQVEGNLLNQSVIISQFDIKKHLTANNLDVNKLLEQPAVRKEENKAFDKLALIYQMSEELNKIINNEEKLFERSFEFIERGLNFDNGYIMLLSSTGELECKAKKKNQENILISRTIANKVMEEQVGIITMDAGQDTRFSASASIANLKITSAMCVPIWRNKQSRGIIYIDNSLSSKQFSEDDLKFLTAFANQISLGLEKIDLIKNLEKELTVKTRLQRYLSPDVVSEIISNPRMLELGGERKKVSVLFADIRNFTVFSQETPVDLLVEMINEYFSETVKIIFSERGTIDKFMGDAIMAVFGAPVSFEQQELSALRSAIKIQNALNILRARWQEKYNKKFHIGIGISTGEVIAGNVGSKERMDYTIMGHAVNLAARICSSAPADCIYICANTLKAVEQYVNFEKLSKS